MTQNVPPKTKLTRLKGSIQQSLGFRLFLISSVAVLLLIPSAMMTSLIRERTCSQGIVVEDIAQKWSGGTQLITGPIITIPYKAHCSKETEDRHGNIEVKRWVEINYAHFLPGDLTIKGEITPEIRYRGIYKVLLFRAALKIKGTFSEVNFKKLGISGKDVIWEKARLAIGLSRVKGITEKVQLKWNAQDIALQPGVDATLNAGNSGISTKIAINPDKAENHYSFDLNLYGHESLSFVPLGKKTEVELSSSWNDPSFRGEYLPRERVIDEKGFSAKWKVLDINREFPQQWVGGRDDISHSWFGVQLFLSVDHYHQSMRMIKYSLLFIMLTFLTFFIIEAMHSQKGIKLHFANYLLIGCALILFYSLLLSLSEHLGFNWAYLIASISIIGMITGYTKSILKDIRLCVIVAGILTVIYTYLFKVVQSEDYALVAGSAGLFIVLAALMYFSRKIDWHGLSSQKNNTETVDFDKRG